MKSTLIILSFFVAGVLLGITEMLPGYFIENDFTIYALYFLLFCVGVSLGCDDQLRGMVKKMKPKVLLVPIGTIVGTLLGSFVISFFMRGFSISDVMAVGSGFGYYSLSTVFITQYKGAELGTIALTANIFREIFALLCAPLLVTFFGKLAPIAAGGATTMDTTLPVITRYSGKDWVFVAILHGFVVDFSVPFLVTFFCTI